MHRVVLAMSGGVDSSTAAVLLRDSGCEVVGCTMQLWDYRRNPLKDGAPQHGSCCSLDDVYDARRVAEHLGFPFYVLNLQDAFERQVIEPFIGSYLEGRTPSPCILCNTFLKFDRLLLFARQIGVDYVATGHYARVEKDGQAYVLRKGRDESKDQSYYLFELSQEQLAHTLFPVGDHDKAHIRKVARQSGLLTAGKPESQEICFVPDRDYVGFIRRHAGEVRSDFLPVLENADRPGPIRFKDGRRLGRHQGLFHFTVGQRKGLRIAHPEPLYVMKIDRPSNTVWVGHKGDLYSPGLIAKKVSWISGRPPQGELRAEVKIRSRHAQAPASIKMFSDGGAAAGETRAEVVFDQPQLSVSPGQAAVFYRGDRVLGGGWIERQLPLSTSMAEVDDQAACGVS